MTIATVVKIFFFFLGLLGLPPQPLQQLAQEAFALPESLHSGVVMSVYPCGVQMAYKKDGNFTNATNYYNPGPALCKSTAAISR